MRKLYLIIPIILLIYLSCEDKKEEDTVPPTVTITFPQNNTTVFELVNITCISSDNEEVEKVELWLNGVSNGMTDETEPYSFTWNTNEVDNGNYTITIRSYDTSENTTDSQPIILSVDNTQSNPQPVNITSFVFDNGGFTITWNPSTDGDFSLYELEKSFESSMNDYTVVYSTNEVGNTNYVDTDIDPLIYQYYRVTVIDTFDYETKGEIYSSSLDPVPASINVESIEYDTEQMTISWSESFDGDFKHYNLLHSESESGDKTSVTTINNKSTTSYSITEFNPNNENWYWVEVSDTLGQTSIGTGMANSLNNQPNPVDVTSVTYDLESMTITWEDYIPNLSRINQMNQNRRNTLTNDFVSYELLQSDSEDGTYTSVIVITDQSTTSHSITEYDPTMENWFKVKVTDYWGLNSTGNEMTNDIDSPPTQVDILSVTYDLTEMVVTWEQSSDNDFVSYELLLSAEGSIFTSVVVITDLFTTSHSITDYDPTMENWFKVKVTDYWGLNSTGDGMTNDIDSPPTQVDILSVTYDLESMTISWEQSNDYDFVSYELLQSAGGGAFTSVVAITDRFTISHSITDYDPTMENWFKVKVTDYWGLNSTGNEMTNNIDSPPTQVDITSVYYGSESINISWEESSDDDFSSYQLLSSETYNGEQTSITTISDINNTSYTITGFNSLENRWYWIKVSDYWNLETIGNGYNFEIAPLAFSDDFTNPNPNWVLNQYFSFQDGILIHQGMDDGFGHSAIISINDFASDGSVAMDVPFSFSADVKWISGEFNLRSIGFSGFSGTRYCLMISYGSWAFKSWDSNNGWNDIITWTNNDNITSEGRLKMLCLDSTLIFYFDDHLLGSIDFQLDTPPEILRLYSQMDAVVEFDNIALRGFFLDGNSRQSLSDEGDRISNINREEKALNMPENDHYLELIERFSNDSFKVYK